MEKFRQISFAGIPSFPHPISYDLIDKVVKFYGNNAITSEEHLRFFIDMLNDFKFEHEDVVMKLYAFFNRRC